MEEEGWEARYLLVLAVLNDEVYCDLKSGLQLVARVSFSLVLKEEGRREGRGAERGEFFKGSRNRQEESCEPSSRRKGLTGLPAAPWSRVYQTAELMMSFGGGGGFGDGLKLTAKRRSAAKRGRAANEGKGGERGEDGDEERTARRRF